MKKTLLDQVLDFKGNKNFYTQDEKEKIRKDLLKKLNANIKKLGNSLYTALDDITRL